jgi:hypothetical protein
MLSATCCTGSAASLEAHSVEETTHCYSAISYGTLGRSLFSTAMKRSNSTYCVATPDIAGDLEKELKEIQKGLAWTRTEQKEMKRWIRDAVRDPSSLSRS